MTQTDNNQENYSNRRNSPRTESCIPSVMIDKSTMAYSTILDFSDTGLCFTSAFPFELDDEVELIIRRKSDIDSTPIRVKLNVRHCQVTPNGNFTIGAQLSRYFKELKSVLLSHFEKGHPLSLSSRLNLIFK